jgi:dipeptidyl-peptidase 4
MVFHLAGRCASPYGTSMMVQSLSLLLLLMSHDPTHLPGRAAPRGPKALDLARVFADPPLEGRQPNQVEMSPAGNYVGYLKPSAADSEVLDLWAKPLPSGDDVLLVAAADLLGGKTQQLTEAEKMMLERKRIIKRGITSYQWCGEDGRALLFPFDGDLVHVQLQTGQAPKVVRLTRNPRAELAPACSKSGRQVSFVADGALVVIDVSTGVERVRMKAGADQSVGLAEFIAEEELDRHEGHWWSEDEQFLLVAAVDERNVGLKTRPQIYADKTEMVAQRYPAAGENNAVVTLWRVHASKNDKTGMGEKLAMPMPAGEEYLVRAGFFADGQAWMQSMNRSQTRLRLWGWSTSSSAWTQVIEDNDAAWVETHHDLRELPNQRLLWSSEQSGRRQLEIIDRKTGKRSQVTRAPEKIVDVIAVDAQVGTAGMAFVHVALDRGQEQRVAAVDLDNGAITPLFEQAGWTGWGSAVADVKGTSFVWKQSSWGVPPVVRVMDRTGRERARFETEVHEDLARALRPPVEWLSLVAADGKTPINALLMKPPKVRGAASVPMIVYAYGGPTGQVVAKRWARQYPVWLHWAQQGYAVLLVDTRGMGQRDREVARAHHHAFSKMEVADLFTAVQQTTQRFLWVDKARVGIFGWSYGGTLATRAILDANTPFAAAVAVAPVTDWRLYDTAYTERYLGMPQAQASLYDDANAILRAGLLTKPFLLVHGTADDNVLFENSLRLIEALQRDQKSFELMVYPGKAHGISGNSSQRHVYETISDFWRRRLQPRAE